MTDESTTEAQTKTTQSTTSRKILIALLIGVCALWGLDFQAKLKWQKALNGANELMDVFENNPATYMEKVGKPPRINVEDNKLTQVYRWTGSLKSYDLLISFRGKDGSGGVDDVVGRGTRVFGTEDISKMQLAEKTGTLDENFVVPEIVSTSDSSLALPTLPPLEGLGTKEDSQINRGRGLRGENLSGGFGQSFQGFKDSDLKMDTETKSKWDATVKELNEALENLPEDRRERFTKMRELQQNFRENAKDFLTENQYAIFEKNNPERQRGGRSSSISADQLSLGGDVKAKYESATEKMRGEMRAMFTGGGGDSREEMREKMAKLREQHETELKSILSEEQFKKYQELRSQQSQRGGRSREPGNNTPPSEPSSGN